MENTLNSLFAALSKYSRREQTAILLGGLLVLLYIIWLALISPLTHKRDLLTRSTASNEQSLGRVQLLARQVEQLSQAGAQASAGADISGLIDASLRENGLAMSSFIPGAGGEVRVRIDKAASEPMMQWLYDLESKHHIAIRELSIIATNEPGQVSINARLIKP